MPLLGAHMSIAGGYYKAVEAAGKFGMEVVQLFTKNNTQWKAKPITHDDVELFQTQLKTCGVRHPLSHSSYLINLASPNEELWDKSIAAYVMELERAHQLGIPYVVLHPGAFTSSSEAEGLKRIIAALDRVHVETAELSAQCLLETTAGQGSDIGWRFEHLAAILNGVKQTKRLGVCVDTCHIFAAGYPLSPQAAYDETFGRFHELIGLDRIRAFHLNDSKKPLGSRRDRHEHIGRGELGLEPFRLIVNDARLAHVPMYMETPKGVEDGTELDAMNLGALRSLVGKTRLPRKKEG